MPSDRPKHLISDTLIQRSQGGNQKKLIAWSRQGHIAYAAKTSNGEANLFLTYMECVNGKTWQLAPDTEFSVGSELIDGDISTGLRPRKQGSVDNSLPDIQLLSFSNTGWDLFAADENGNVSILVTGIKRLNHDKDFNSSYGQQQQQQQQSSNSGTSKASPAFPSLPAIQYSRTSFNTAEMFYSDLTQSPLPKTSTPRQRRLNQLVTMKWLNIQKPVIASAPAIKLKQDDSSPVTNGCASKLGAASQDAHGSYFTYKAHQYKPYGAMHPLMTKQACIGIRRNGQICLWHQEDHGIEYKRVSTMLDLEGDDDEVLDASIAFSRSGDVIVAVHTITSNSLKFYDIKIDWGYLVEAAKHLATMPSYRVPDDERIPPKLVVGKIFKYNLGDLSANNQRLVSIDMISPNFHQSTEIEVLLTFEKERVYSKDPVKTTLVRYQLKEVLVSDKIHQAFKDIGKKSTSNMDSLMQKKRYQMIYMQRFTFNESILSIQPMKLEMILVVSFCNGMIKLLERGSFEFHENPYNRKFDSNEEEEDSLIPSSISTLIDAGFEFPQMEIQPEFCCVSPNLCSYTFIPFNSSRLYIKSLQSKIDPSFYEMKKSGLLLTTASALALTHTSACYLGFFTDDLIAAIRIELVHIAKTVSPGRSNRLLVAILQECQRAINLNIDISTDQTDKMSQNQPLQRLLTLQLSLGTDTNWKRNRSAKIALSIVNMRFVASSVMYAIHTIYSNMQRFSHKGLNTIDTYANSKVREDSIIYIIGVIRWCLDYVAFLGKELLELQSAFQNNNQTTISQLMEKLCMVPLMLGKVPRLFLIFSIANIRRLFSFVQKFVEKNYSTLTTEVTPENTFGAFEKISSKLFVQSSASILDDASTEGRSKSASDKAAAISRAIVAHPTVEAYYRIGAMITNCPVPLQEFEKFLLEADSTLRNLGLDPETSLAVEQQIVCQGHVPKNFVGPMKKLCAMYDKSILSLPKMDVPRLYFYDTQWLRLDGYEDDIELESFLQSVDGSDQRIVEPTKLLGDLAQNKIDTKLNAQEGRDTTVETDGILLETTNYELSRKGARRLIFMNCYNGLVLDTLRKRLMKPSAFIQYEKPASETNSPDGIILHGISTDNLSRTDINSGERKKISLRFCIRCGAISSLHDEMLLVPGHPSLIENPVFQHYQRICFCGGSWSNI